ncbi:interleukin-20 receptor subunit alpha [Syngnathus typhle]
MRAVLFLVIFGALDSSTGSSCPPSPVNVTFSSLNLKNVLEWLPGKQTPEGTRYTAQLAFYGASVGASQPLNWRPVPRCKETERTRCDLSNQTWDLEQLYYGRVRAAGGTAFSEWVVTPKRFKPKADTCFGPPQISVEVKEDVAIVYLSGPMRYQPDERGPPISMAQLYPQMTYNLSVHDRRRERVSHFAVPSSPYKYRLMDFETEYCFSAKARFLAWPFHCQWSERRCITTGEDPLSGQAGLAAVAIVVPSLCICASLVLGYLLYHYLTGDGHKLPRSLLMGVASLHLQPNLATLLPDPVGALTSQRSSEDDAESNKAPDYVRGGQRPLPPPPEERCGDSSSYGVVGPAAMDGGKSSGARPEELGLKNAPSQCYVPQVQSRLALDNATQTQADFATKYLSNTLPDGLKMAPTEVTGDSYRRPKEDRERPSPAFTSRGDPWNLLADNANWAERDEEGGPLCVQRDPEKREPVLRLEMTSGRGEVAEADLRSEKPFVRYPWWEEAEPLCWEVEDMVRNWDLVISDK